MKNVAEQTREMLARIVAEKFNGNMSQASRFLGVDTQSGLLRKWITGERSPTLLTISAVYERLGITLHIPDEDMAEYDLVPKHAAKAGAGASLETSDATEGLYAFRKDWMLSQGIHAKNAVLLDVVGDSMEPLLHDGDSLLIDKQDTEIRDGKIYVVTLGEELRVKRIYRSLDGIILRSENQRYPDVPVSGPDLETVRIHGRVKWCGKIL